MKKILIAFSLLLFPFIINAQTFIKAQLLDSLNKAPIIYANIGIINKSTGTVSDENGNFTLTIPDSLINDQLKISCIGYKSIIIQAKKLTNTSLIYLIPYSTNIKEVLISTKRKITTKTLGNETKSQFFRAGLTSNILGSEIAVPLRIKHPNTRLKNIQFNIIENPYDSLLFRFNVYNIDKKRNPDENILNQIIIIKPPNKTGLVKFDLNQYNIYCNSDIFIALEWIKDFGLDSNKHLSFSSQLFNGETYYRNASQDKWGKNDIVGVGLWAEVEY